MAKIPGGGGPLAIIAAAMAFIESNKLYELFITDFGAMVAPRTIIDWNKRGFDAGREVFFREIMGSLTNVFLVGWAGIAALQGTKHHFFNPKGMSYQAWVDSSTLDYFGNITKEVLKEAAQSGKMTARDVQREVLDKMLSRIQSSDNMHRAYKEYLPHGGKLAPEVRKQIVDKLLGETNGFGAQANNIEAEVAKQLQLTENRNVLKKAMKGAQEAFRSERGIGPKQALSDLQKLELRKLLIRERYAALNTLKSQVRKAVTGSVRKSEDAMLKDIVNLMTTDGHLTGEIFHLGKNGKMASEMGMKELRTTVNQVKYFMEEFLNRSLADVKTGRIAEGVLGQDAMRSAERKLFGTASREWFAKNVIPHFKDGLLPYAYKAKRFLIGLPMIFALVAGVSTVLINNYLTARKYGGKNFFPGEQLGGGH